MTSPAWPPTDSADVMLARLTAVSLTVTSALLWVDELALDCVRAGVTWDELGAALGVTPTEAFTRYGHSA